MGERFKVIYREGTFAIKEVFVDTLTGVNYLRSVTAKGESMVPLYDPYGKIIVSPIVPPQQQRPMPPKR